MGTSGHMGLLTPMTGLFSMQLASLFLVALGHFAPLENDLRMTKSLTLIVSYLHSFLVVSGMGTIGHMGLLLRQLHFPQH